MDFMHIYRNPARLYTLGFNAIAVIAGVGLTGVGIVGLASSTRPLFDTGLLSWLLIALGFAVLHVALLGCAASLTESKPVLRTYRATVALLVLLQLGLIIYTLTRHYKVDDILDLAWQKAYDHEPRILQDLETSRGCCGYSSVGDRAIPKSSKYACRDSPAFGYDTSCQRQLRQSFLRHENTILGLVAGVQFLQLLALASAMLLWAHLPSDDQIEEQYRGEHSQRLLQGLREEDQQQGQPYRTSETLNGQGQYGATDNQPR